MITASLYGIKNLPLTNPFETKSYFSIFIIFLILILSVRLNT